MSKISAQIWAFVVLMVALVIGVLFVNDQDLNTEVKTKEETVLPNLYPAEGEESPTGLTFRYPRDWTVIAQDTSFLLSKSVDEATRYDVDFTVEQGEADLETELLSFMQEQGFPIDPQAFEKDVEEAEHGLNAVRYELRDEVADTITPFEVIQLTGDNIILKVSGTGVDKGDWSDIEDDIDTILRSINASSVSIPEPLFTYTLPEGWQLQGEAETNFAAGISDASGQSGASTQFVIIPTGEVLEALKGFVVQAIDPNAAVAEDETVEALFQTIAELEAVQDAEVTTTEFLGFDGDKVVFKTANDALTELTVVEANDQDTIVVVVTYFPDTVQETYQAQVEELLTSIQYNAPEAE